jgi:hypothetical protein
MGSIDPANSVKVVVAATVWMMVFDQLPMSRLDLCQRCPPVQSKDLDCL